MTIARYFNLKPHINLTPQKGKNKEGKEVLNVSTTEVEDIEETSNTDGNPRFLEIIKDCKSKRIDLLLRLQGNTPPTPDGERQTILTFSKIYRLISLSVENL